MAEINLDDVDPHKRDVVVLQTIQPHHALVKANRFLLMLVFGLIAIVFVLGFVLLPRQNFLEEIGRTQTAAAYATQNPVLSAEINTLKGQMFGLVSGSIESKLRSLEDNIRRGSVSDSLDTLQDLKSEVKILSTYSQESPAKAEQAVVDQRVIKELSELKGLIYLTFVSCGLMIAALAGVWLRHRYRLTHQQRHRAYLSRED
jgi:Tfp pilus assembly protein PilN